MTQSIDLHTTLFAIEYFSVLGNSSTTQIILKSEKNLYYMFLCTITLLPHSFSLFFLINFARVYFLSHMMTENSHYR